MSIAYGRENRAIREALHRASLMAVDGSIDTGIVLRGLLAAPDRTTRKFLDRAQVDLPALVREIDVARAMSDLEPKASGFTQPAKAAIEVAYEENLKGYGRAGGLYLLLGLALSSGIANAALRKFGVEEGSVRAAF